jgi:hypothetical protein
MMSHKNAAMLNNPSLITDMKPLSHDRPQNEIEDDKLCDLLENTIVEKQRTLQYAQNLKDRLEKATYPENQSDASITLY